MKKEFFEELVDLPLQEDIKRLNNRLGTIKIEKGELLDKKRKLKLKIEETTERTVNLKKLLNDAKTHINGLKRRAWQVKDVNVSELRRQVLIAAKKAQVGEDLQKEAANS